MGSKCCAISTNMEDQAPAFRILLQLLQAADLAALILSLVVFYRLRHS